MESLLWQIAVSLALGALIGFEREISHLRSKYNFGGVRTYTFFSLLGSIAGVLSVGSSGLAVALLIGVVVLACSSSVVDAVRLKRSVDLVPSLSAILAFFLGLLVTTGFLSTAVILAVVIATILALKRSWKGFASKISPEEVYSTLTFLVVILVVLPLLPNVNYSPLDIPAVSQVLSLSPTAFDIAGRLDVLNPRSVWLMVVFVSSISFLGYALVRLVGPKRGIELTSVLGGLVSSTAVTSSLALLSKKSKAITNTLTLGVLLASIIMFLRVLFEVLVLNKVLFFTLVRPLGVMVIVGVCAAVYLHLRKDSSQEHHVELSSPFSLKPALFFGLFYLFVIFSSKLLHLLFSNTGAYIASTLSGLADVDAITLTFSQLSATGAIEHSVAATAITLAVLSNTVVKAGIAFVMGRKLFSRQVITVFGIVLLSGIITLLFA